MKAMTRGHEMETGIATLEKMRMLRNYNDWTFDRLRPYLGRRVIEVGAGIGNFSVRFLEIEELVVAEYDRQCLARLRNRFADHPRLKVEELDLGRPLPAAVPADYFDTVVCMNVLEHIREESVAVRNLKSLMKPDGHLFLLVPAHQAIFGELDRALAHLRRYDASGIRTTLEREGLRVEQTSYFNPFCVIPWWINSKVLRRGSLPAFQSRLFDAWVPLLRRLTPRHPRFGLSIIAVARKG